MAKRITSHDQNGDDILNLFKKDQDGATSIDVNHRVRVGIIGTGWIAAAHIKSYLKMPDVDIVAGADLIPGKAETFFKNQGVENVLAIKTSGRSGKRSSWMLSASVPITALTPSVLSTH